MIYSNENINAVGLGAGIAIGTDGVADAIGVANSKVKKAIRNGYRRGKGSKIGYC